MDVTQVLESLREQLGREAVFGEPLTQDGTVVLPVLRVSGGAGGGEGDEGEPGEGRRRWGRGHGSGVGFGYGAAPAGVYAIREGKVTWQPAVDANRVILGGQILGALGLLVLWTYLRGRAAASAARAAALASASEAESGEPLPDTET